MDITCHINCHLETPFQIKTEVGLLCHKSSIHQDNHNAEYRIGYKNSSRYNHRSPIRFRIFFRIDK
nr:MAG TPA: hypothetical protein [Caudoviricetes sp.]DAW40257.1 MAG TPA: hypothetical protein [Caudoviricetes sp.]DAX17695.1 MAG TPA: hypothetical protein [Caudoviricetes sp.]